MMEFNTAIKETLAVHEGLRRLGFQSENIFLRPQFIRDGFLMIHVALRVQGNEFNIAVDVFEGSPTELERQWIEAIEWWNNRGTVNQLAEVWDTSKMRRTGGAALAAQLLKRGIKIPNVERDRVID
jgi:hypothetical protein